MAEVAIPRSLFADILRLIAELAAAASELDCLKVFVCHALEPNLREGCASMTENTAIFNARHGAGSFRPHRQPANGAGLPKTRKRGKLANDPAAIW
jgi:hypothetical protein